MQTMAGQGTFQNVPGRRASDSAMAVVPRHCALLVAPAPWLVGTGVIAQVDEVKSSCMPRPYLVMLLFRGQPTLLL